MSCPARLQTFCLSLCVGIAAPVLSAIACGRIQSSKAIPSSTTVFEHGTLIDGSGSSPVPDAVIVVRDGRVVAAGPSRSTRTDSGVQRVDLRGTTIVPGFVDMHFHATTAAMRYLRDAHGLDSTYDRALAERLLRVALGMGITTIRDPGASPREASLALRADLNANRIVGPRLFTAGEIINNPQWTEEQSRASVRAQAAAGVDFIKVYAGIRPAQLRVVVDEAHRHGLRVIGHLQRTSWTEAARIGIDFLTHGANWHESYLPPERRDEYLAIEGMSSRVAWYEWMDPNGAPIDTMIAELVRHHVSVDPTLIAYHTKFWWSDCLYQHDPEHAIVPELVKNWEVLGMPTSSMSAEEFRRAHAAWPKQLALVRRMHDAGVLLTAGSDVSSPWVIPGVSFHQELRLLHSAGLSNGEVLAIGTTHGTRALGIDGDVGVIAPGKRADFVVLERDPLRDIRATRSIRFVVKDGVRYDPKLLLGR